MQYDAGSDRPDGIYASEWVGNAFAPGWGQQPDPRGMSERHTRTRMLKVRESLYGFVQDVWVPWTTVVWNRYIGPRAPTHDWESPYDLVAAERITRFGDFPSGARLFPYPYEIGAVSGMMPMLDQYSMSWGYARNSFGPGVMTPIPIPWAVAYPDFQKTTG